MDSQHPYVKPPEVSDSPPSRGFGDIKGIKCPPIKSRLIEQANARTDEANIRMQEADARTDLANIRTAEANVRTEQADSRTEKSETQTQMLRASELSYRRLFESARDGILILNADTGRIIDVNPFLIELLGFSHSHMLGKTVGELSPFKDLLSNQAMLERLQKEGYIRYEDLPLETRDGRRISVEFVSNVYRAGDEQVIQCNIRDISERKRTEGAMIASEARYRRLFEAAKDGILILNAATGRIVDVNPYLAGLLGYPRETFIGKHLWELGFFKDIAASEAHFQELQAREYIRYDDLPLETCDGRRIDVEFVSNTYIVDGHRVMQCNIRDITERKAAKLGLSRLGAIVESSNDAIFGTDLDEIITNWNRGAEILFGYTAGEMVGTSITRLIPADRQEEEHQIRAKIKRGEPIGHVETLRRTKDGRLVDVSVTASPIKDAAGKVIGVSKILRDVTVRKKHESEIGRLSRLYAALSHVNQTIVTVNNREALFAKICRVLVEIGQLRMAWVGWLDTDTRRVNPVAQYGDHLNYLSQVIICADDRPEGQGPTGTAIREARPYICNDFSHDPRTLPWRKAAAQAGFQSSASLVIRLGGVICGVITVYAGEVDFFQDKEIALLEEVASDISFALDNFVRAEARRQAEIELRWKTAFLEAQVNSTLDGILVVNDQGKKILQNQRMCDLWKIPPEVAGNPDDKVQVEFVTSRTKHPREFAGKVAYLYAHPDTASRDEVELVDGTVFDRYSAPVRDPAGKYYGRIWSFTDITQRKKTENALWESKRFLSSALDALSAHIAILDENGNIISANLAWKFFAHKNHFLGSECDIGANYLQVCDAAAGQFSNVAPAVAAGIRAIIAGQREMFTLEYPCQGSKGQGWFILRTTRFSGGGPARVVVAHENISEQKRIELRFRRLVDSNAQGVVFWNTQGQITSANDAFLKLLGYTPADLAAGPIDWFDITPPHYADLDRRALKQIADTGVCVPFEKEYIRKDGRHVPILIGAAAFEDAPDEGVCFVLDLTERKSLEAQFRQAQKMEAIGTLAGGVAHDFNNILGVISMQAHLLKSGAKLSAEQTELADDIGLAVQRAAALTRQLLLFSRKQTLQLGDLDLNASITELNKMLKRTLGENIAVQLQLAPQPMLLRADSGMMDQVLLNLAVNARDAMPDGGRLVIETAGVEFDEFAARQTAQARPGSFVCLSVSDTGCGIPPENLARIFEPFFTTKAVGKGTGLGLATVFGIAQQHQGWVSVHSEVGHGTIFKIYLPRLAESPDSTIIKKPPATAQAGHETILLVEDEFALRTAIKLSLARLGYQVLEAATGFKALEVWQTHASKIDLLLTDLMMPDGMTGNQLGQRLLQGNPKLKVIYMSGYRADMVARDLLLLEGVNFLTKPFPLQNLAQTIRSVLDDPAGEKPPA